MEKFTPIEICKIKACMKLQIDFLERDIEQLAYSKDEQNKKDYTRLLKKQIRDIEIIIEKLEEL